MTALQATRASGKAHTPKVARTQGSLREGAGAGGLPRATEGECVTIKLAQTPNYAGSFRHGYAVPPHPLADGISEGGFSLVPS